MYNAVVPLDVMLDKFDFSKNTEFKNKKEVAAFQILDKRYFKPELSAKNKISFIFAKKIKDQLFVKKHDRIRRDPVEKSKLDCIEKALATN